MNDKFRTPTLKEVFENPTKYNNLIPSPAMAETPEGVKFRMAPVWIDPNPDNNEIYSVQAKKNSNGDWVEHFALAKPALNRILAAANASAIVDYNRDIGSGVKQASVRIVRVGMDGRERYVPGTFDLDVDAEIDAFRAKQENALEKYGKIVRTEWVNKKKVESTYEGERARAIIENEVVGRGAQIRKFAAATVETKAMLRAIKMFFAVKESYTNPELNRPFIVYWYEHAATSNPEHLSSELYPGRHVHVDSSTGPDVGAITVVSDGVLETRVVPPQPTALELAKLDTAELFNQIPSSTAKPSVADRIKMLDELSGSEIVELTKDLCIEKGVPMPGATDPKLLKGFILAVSS